MSARALDADVLLRADGVDCERGGRVVFENVDFALRSGEALVLRGPNGSGKTTLLRVLAGFLQPSLGAVRYSGLPLDRVEGGAGAVAHFVGHLNGLKPLLNATENLNAACGLAGGGDVAAGLRAFNLEALAATPARMLSAGQKRRLALAKLAAAPRKLWLLDEPAVGLDAASRALLEGLIYRHRAGGGALVVATHGDVSIPDPLVLEMG